MAVFLLALVLVVLVVVLVVLLLCSSKLMGCGEEIVA